MIERYRDPKIAIIFDEDRKYDEWRKIELDFLHCWVLDGHLAIEDYKVAQDAPPPQASLVSEYERYFGHDVVGFLSAWTRNMPDRTKRWVHLGLTSSDLVDNYLFGTLRESGAYVAAAVDQLRERLEASIDELSDSDAVRLARTHGQIAEPVPVWHQIQVWMETAEWLAGPLYNEVERSIAVMKSPGPTGYSRVVPGAHAYRIAERYDLQVVTSTQVIPRQRLMAWAGWLLQVVSLCETIAMEVRLSARSEIGEMIEGVSRVGSSSMPTKQNPIQSERISGLARVARSHYAALAETAGALHNERDISNSSVERIIVPDLAHLVAFMVQEVYDTLDSLEINASRMAVNVKSAIWVNSMGPAMAATWQAALQLNFEIGPVEASALTRRALGSADPYYTVFKELNGGEPHQGFVDEIQRAREHWIPQG